jgi:hypothetical protein
MANGTTEPIEPSSNTSPGRSPYPSGEIYSAPTPPSHYRETFTPSSKRKLMKIVVGVIATFFILFLIVGASVYFYQKKINANPISLLPESTALFFRVKINPNNIQVANFKSLLRKFPYYEKVSEKIEQELTYLEYQTPEIRGFDFTISDEAIFAVMEPLEDNLTEEPPYVLILPNPDRKKLEKLSKDIQNLMEKNKEWKMEKETYRGITITKALPGEKNLYPKYYSKPQSEMSFSMINGHFVFSMKAENIKKIIDVVQDQKITSIFKKNKAKNITANASYQKIKKYLPKDYLFLSFNQSDLSKIVNTVETVSNLNTESPISLLSSLNLAFNSLLLNKNSSSESGKIILASAIIADESGLKMESYSLDSRKDAFVPAEFNLGNALASVIPEKIGDREIAFYSEGRDLDSAINYIEKSILEKMTLDNQNKYKEKLGELKEILGTDLKNDILPLFKENYAFFVASDSAGKSAPIASFVFELDDIDKTKENLLKLKVPKTSSSIFDLGLGEARAKAKDARIMADMSQIRAMAELIYDDEGSYANVRCSYKNTTSYSDVKTICEDIENQIGIKPVMYQSRDRYCAYSSLNEEGSYYCIDSTGKAIKTFDAPSYCRSTSLSCSSFSGTPPEKFLKPLETDSFSKETVDGFEIYSMPLVDNVGLYFLIMDKKLILTFTKGALVDVLKSFTDSDQKKLVNNDRFKEQFNSIPQSVTSISYNYPLGFTGAVKYLANFFINLRMSSSYYGTSESNQKEIEVYNSIVNELVDRGVAPYLKMLYSGASNSYAPEKGLMASKGNLIIRELSSQEKKAAEDFWDNIETWIMEKEEILYPYDYSYNPSSSYNNSYYDNASGTCPACAACKTCSAGSCVNTPDTKWGAGTYSCTGSDKRCYRGSCIQCGGWSAYGFCWYTGSAGGSCTSACASRGGVYGGNCAWSGQPSDCSVPLHFVGSCISCVAAWYGPANYEYSGHYCRKIAGSSGCSENDSYTYRYCACNQ